MSKRSVLTFSAHADGRRCRARSTRRSRRGNAAQRRSPSGRSSPPASRWRSRPRLGALAQGKAIAAAAEAIARNPGAAGDIRGALILGLVLIESLVIYVLLISLILFFLRRSARKRRRRPASERRSPAAGARGTSVPRHACVPSGLRARAVSLVRAPSTSSRIDALLLLMTLIWGTQLLHRQDRVPRDRSPGVQRACA